LPQVVADTRALAEDAAEAVAVEYEPLPFVLDADEAYAGGPLVHEAHGSNVLLDRTFVGRGRERLSPRAHISSSIASNGAAARRCRSRRLA
jgi:CO/xanthine dehydrogenase Mo-binding subunit